MKIAALSLALVACGASQPASPPLANHAAGAQLADAMCRCQDRNCADQVMDEMTRWAEELASAGEAEPMVTSAQSAQAKAAASRISQCMSGAYRRRPGSIAPP